MWAKRNELLFPRVWWYMVRLRHLLAKAKQVNKNDMEKRMTESEEAIQKDLDYVTPKLLSALALHSEKDGVCSLCHNAYPCPPVITIRDVLGLS
jgi:hypothetical protein